MTVYKVQYPLQLFMNGEIISIISVFVIRMIFNNLWWMEWRMISIILLGLLWRVGIQNLVANKSFIFIDGDPSCWQSFSNLIYIPVACLTIRRPLIGILCAFIGFISNFAKGLLMSKVWWCCQPFSTNIFSASICRHTSLYNNGLSNHPFVYHPFYLYDCTTANSLAFLFVHVLICCIQSLTVSNIVFAIGTQE